MNASGISSESEAKVASRLSREASRCLRSVMKNIACQLEHSVEAEVSSSFAWSWRTDINNWDDPPAQFQLDGPFASGSWPSPLRNICFMFLTTSIPFWPMSSKRPTKGET